MFLSLFSYIVLYQPRWSSRGIIFMTKPYVSLNWEERINSVKHVSSFTRLSFHFLVRERGGCVYVYQVLVFFPIWKKENQQQANPSWSTAGDTSQIIQPKVGSHRNKGASGSMRDQSSSTHLRQSSFNPLQTLNFTCAISPFCEAAWEISGKEKFIAFSQSGNNCAIFFYW